MCGYGSCTHCGRCEISRMVKERNIVIPGKCECGYLNGPLDKVCAQCGATLRVKVSEKTE